MMQHRIAGPFLPDSLSSFFRAGYHDRSEASVKNHLLLHYMPEQNGGK